jgi:hypothetical protein
MRFTGHTLNQALKATRLHAPSVRNALFRAKLLALRCVYETTVYARFTYPGEEEAQRSLREAIETCRLLRRLGEDVAKLRKQIHEARSVPMALADVDALTLMPP